MRGTPTHHLNGATEQIQLVVEHNNFTAMITSSGHSRTNWNLVAFDQE